MSRHAWYASMSTERCNIPVAYQGSLFATCAIIQTPSISLQDVHCNHDMQQHTATCQERSALLITQDTKHNISLCAVNVTFFLSDAFQSCPVSPVNSVCLLFTRLYLTW